MKTLAFAGCALLLASSLSGCGGNVGGSQGAFSLLQQITTDPHCAHDDDLTITTTALGPMISGHAGRHCLAQAQVIEAPAVAPIVTGPIVVPK